MNLLDSLKQHIASGLAAEKSYNLPGLCTSFGLAPGDETEAFASKYKYVLRRVQPLAKDEVVALAKQVLQHSSSYQLQETLDLLLPLEGVIPAITRRDLIDKLSDTGDLHGRLYINEFLERTFPLSQMPYDDYRFQNLKEAVAQHMSLNDDWSYKDFLECADYLKLSERRFRAFLEQIVHPEVRTGDDQKRFVDLINPYLQRDGFELRPVEEISGYPVYRVIKKGGVSGRCKNLIFAANGPKPELVLADALNNDIRITKHGDFCLVYDLPIGIEGLRWQELVQWWGSRCLLTIQNAAYISGSANRLPPTPKKTSSGSIFKFYAILCRTCFPPLFRRFTCIMTLTPFATSRTAAHLPGSGWISCFCCPVTSASSSK
jgi:AbiJ N-terminal domain 3